VILVLNSGSSSLKYRLVDPDASGQGPGGVIARIGEPGEVPDHRAALERVFAAVAHERLAVSAVGHRIVHGGSAFREPVLVDDAVVAVLRELVPLAPLHNPGGIAGIEAAREALPDLPHVAVFDTAFHATLPDAAATYAVDRETATRYGIRRYGFHGTSYEFVASRAAVLLGRPLHELNLIVLHLGNGASAAAIAGGRSVETSMGMSPLEGLVMGTRCGDLDPAIVFYLHRAAGMDLDAVEDLLTRHSGLAGLCGSNDIRDVLAARAAGDEGASVAFDVYCHRIRKYVGAYHAVLGRVDGIVFTAGIGERTPEIRAACLDGLQMWGITVDAARNLDGPPTRMISETGAPVAVCVVQTDEERAIADHVRAVLAARVPVDRQ
jgi:acetate kinase